MSDLPDWTTGVDIAAQTVGNLAVDIAAQTVGNIAIDIAAQTLGQVNVNIAASAVTINVATAAGEHVDTDIVSSIQLDVNIAAQAVTLGVDITAQSVGNIAIDIAAQSVGNINVNLAASAITLNVNITGSVAINIKTSGGTNIVIDKLTQEAFTTRGFDLVNPALATPPSFFTGYYVGKFFPRGARGFFNSLAIRARNTGGADVDMTFAFSPYPGGPEIMTVVITIPAGDDGTVSRWASIEEFWPYDGLFIYQKTANTAAVGLGYDSTGRIDGYGSTDLVTWSIYPGAWSRPYMSVDVRWGSEGDLPITGSVTAVIEPEKTYQHGGLYLKPEEAARKGTDKNFRAFGDSIASTDIVYGEYTVPADKTLYICGITCAAMATAVGDRDSNQIVTARVYNVTDVKTLVDAGGNGGASAMLTKPIAIAGGKKFQYQARNHSGHDCSLYVSCWGYEI